MKTLGREADAFASVAGLIDHSGSSRNSGHFRLDVIRSIWLASISYANSYFILGF